MEQFVERLHSLVESVPKEKAKKTERDSGQPYSKSFSAAYGRMELPETRSTSSRKQDVQYSTATDRSNALSLNQIPVACQRCGGKLTQVSRGTYSCVDCGQEEYDSYQKVRNYLDKEGPRSATQIMRATGVPRATIEYFFKDERLEIPMASSIRVACEKCGAPIRTGVLCDRCKGRSKVTGKGTKSVDDKYRFLKRDL